MLIGSLYWAIDPTPTYSPSHIAVLLFLDERRLIGRDAQFQLQVSAGAARLRPLNVTHGIGLLKERNTASL